MIRTGDSYARADLDDEAFDVIVIGSGIGGLATAALLARYAGQRVLVLERHYVAGGFTHSFARPGYDWDVGLHYVGDVMRADHPTTRLFDAVTDGEVEWAPMGDVYDRFVVEEGDAGPGRGGPDRDTTTYEYRAGLRAWKQQMLEYFPDERAALDGYVRAVKDVASSIRPYAAEKALPDLAAKVVGAPMRSSFLAHAARTTREVLDELTADERLKTVLTGQWGDYGLPPARSSFAMHAIVTNHYFRGGAYPVGGASVIPAAAARVIERAGGRVLVGAEVEQVLVQRGRAVGVRMADGRELRAGRIVSDAGVHVTYGRLLPDEVATSIGAPGLLARAPRSLSHLTLYLGLDASTEELGLEPPNIWVFPGDDHDANVAAFEDDHEAPFPLVYLSFPSAKDPDFERRHPGHSTIDVITLARHEWFEEWDGTRWHRRGDEYDALKQRFADRLVDEVVARVPSVRGHVDVAELSTPLTTKHFTNYGTGELYGLAHDPHRFEQRWLRPRTPVKGLYLTGQDVFTCGVAAALFSGALTASSMLGVDVLARALRTRLPVG